MYNITLKRLSQLWGLNTCATQTDQNSPTNTTVLSIIDVLGVEQSINTAAVLTAVSRMGDQDTPLNLLPTAAIMWSQTQYDQLCYQVCYQVCRH